ncbi:hypothetical protein G6F64_013997 [Rhizopus arrhizus]|uniref:Uncharacterized protein n=1 Tax=Rhizopus oryzae TaxID=64495 RepID=A0A9P7BK04_RHIOR|nr:hypothetical protein G6F64_013997 [Rhizopus arrhizus]
MASATMATSNRAGTGRAQDTAGPIVLILIWRKPPLPAGAPSRTLDRALISINPRPARRGRGSRQPGVNREITYDTANWPHPVGHGPERAGRPRPGPRAAAHQSAQHQADRPARHGKPFHVGPPDHPGLAAPVLLPQGPGRTRAGRRPGRGRRAVRSRPSAAR